MRELVLESLVADRRMCHLGRVRSSRVVLVSRSQPQGG